MSEEMTSAEFYAECLGKLNHMDQLLVVCVYALCCIAGAQTFVVLMYAARNKNFWG
ncbi:hypothetical protein SH661x_001625 [Planctomicrobium sp. SH661]|uniref:hypothetical protein n=1 Tax=Planctomicrobium sp. SH661 TaxID=3448124 RepID=UPI003F5C9432